MALRLKRSVFLLAAVVVGGCDQGGFTRQSGPVVTSAGGVSQTGTQTVRTRVQQLRADQASLAGGIARQQEQLNATRGQISSEASTYSNLVSSITARLQAGTTPGNPELVSQWNDAQARLDAITMNVGQLNSLASQVTTQASVAGFLVDSVRATFSVGGAVDEDHRNLRSIEAETNRSIQDVDRLIGDLNSEIARQNSFLARERGNLVSLSFSINMGRLGGPGGLQRAPVGGGMPRRIVLGPQATDAPVQLSAVPR